MSSIFMPATVIIAITLALGCSESQSVTGTILITGANRGIGLALAQEYADRGWRVVATARRPDDAAALNALATSNDKVRIVKLDVTNDRDIEALVADLKGEPIDVLLNNAGSNAGGRGQTFGKLDYEVFEELMRVNAIGPLKMAEALMPNLLAGEQKKLIVISSIQASIAKTYGGGYAYRASKATLNMTMRTLSLDLRTQGIIVGILAPGIVATDMTKGLDIPMITPKESAHGIAIVIDNLNPDRSGDFLQYDGTGLPW
jgi:NAD(P)-dependent dehydrogenase (short-subunit alcohol dehydrogenase family)